MYRVDHHMLLPLFLFYKIPVVRWYDIQVESIDLIVLNQISKVSQFSAIYQEFMIEFH